MANDETDLDYGLKEEQYKQLRLDNAIAFEKRMAQLTADTELSEIKVHKTTKELRWYEIVVLTTLVSALTVALLAAGKYLFGN